MIFFTSWSAQSGKDDACLHRKNMGRAARRAHRRRHDLPPRHGARLEARARRWCWMAMRPATPCIRPLGCWRSVQDPPTIFERATPTNDRSATASRARPARRRARAHSPAHPRDGNSAPAVAGRRRRNRCARNAHGPKGVYRRAICARTSTCWDRRERRRQGPRPQGDQGSLFEAGLADHLGGERIAWGAGLITALTRQPASLFQIESSASSSPTWRTSGGRRSISRRSGICSRNSPPAPAPLSSAPSSRSAGAPATGHHRTMRLDPWRQRARAVLGGAEEWLAAGWQPRSLPGVPQRRRHCRPKPPPGAAGRSARGVPRRCRRSPPSAQVAAR